MIPPDPYDPKQVKPKPILGAQPGQPVNVPMGTQTLGGTGISQPLGGAPGMPPPTAPTVPQGGQGGMTPSAQTSARPTAPPMAADQAPQTGGIDPAAIDPQQTWATLTSQFQQKFGRAMTPQEAQALQQYAGYAGGPITQAMIDKATSGINSYSGNLATPFGAPGAPAANTPGQNTDDLAQQEIQRILRGGEALDPNNPALTAQRSNFSRVNSRATGRERLAAAERAAASDGLGSGGYNADLMAVEQGATDRESAFEAQLMTQEVQHQRDKVARALELAVSSGNNAQARALQEKLATLDINLRQRLGTGQLNLGLLQALMGNQLGRDQIGLGYAGLGQRANESLLNAILGL